MKRILLVAVLAVSGSVLFAQETAENPKVATEPDQQQGLEASVNKDATVGIQESPTDQLDSLFQEFADKRGIVFGAADPVTGVIYYNGYQPVRQDRGHAEFIDWRNAAYDIAWQKIIEKYLIDVHGRNMDKTLSKFYRDQSTDRQDAPTELLDKSKGLSAKVVALTDAQLDALLRDQGVDPAKYSKQPITVKRKLAETELITKANTIAVGGITGIIVVDTYEANVGDKVAIGVIGRYDPQLVQLADDVSRQRLPTFKKECGITLKEALPTEREMLSQFGVRLFFDKMGQACLLSFGQSGHDYTGKDMEMRLDAREAALAIAKQRADSNLTKFIAASSTFRSDNLDGSSVQNFAVFNQDGTLEPSATSKKLIKVIDQESKTDAVAYRKGRSDVFSKTLKHFKTNQDVSVVVVMWSMNQVDAINRGKTLESAAPVSVEKTTNQKNNPNDRGVNKGRTYDF